MRIPNSDAINAISPQPAAPLPLANQLVALRLVAARLGLPEAADHVRTLLDPDAARFSDAHLQQPLTVDETRSPERIERALQVLAYLEAVEDDEPMCASEWLECADGLARPAPNEESARWGREA